MKKVILIICFIAYTLCISAQIPSLANMQILWKKQKISNICSQMRNWGYKLTIAKPENDSINVAGRAMWLNNIYYNSNKGEWESRDKKLINRVFVDWIGSITTSIVWAYDSATTHNSIKNQIRNAGWKFDKEEIKNDRIIEFFKNKDSEQIIELHELTDGSYMFGYRIKYDNE